MMKNTLPPLTWFRAFEAAARHLSFTAAAAEIGLTQSAISQQVKSLETRLNVTLFNRRARGLSLTDDGRRLLPQVGTALENLANAADMFDVGPSKTLLTVATSVSIAQWVIAPKLQSFTAKHPGLSIRFLNTVWPDEFSKSLADVDIRFGSQKQVGDGATLLTPSTLVALKSPLLTGKFGDHPLIETVGTSDGWATWCTVVKLDFIQPQLFADSYGMALHLASQGNGFALVSELLAGHALQSGMVVRAHETTIPGKEGYYLSVNKHSPHADDFAAWVRDILAIHPNP